MKRIGVSLSGGGHRATAWAAGTLLYLADAGANRAVTAISSVSGGSIANGVVAQRVDYAATDGEALRDELRPMLHNIADVGLFFFGPATNAYVYGLLALAGVTGLVLLATIVVGIVGSGLLFATGSAATVVLLAVTLVVFGRRSLVAERALASVHFGATRLAEVHDAVDHVFCATELQAGNHFFFSPRYAFGYRVGIGTPGDVSLATVVQASACLPGAFAPRVLPTAPFGFRRVPGVDEPPEVPERLVLNDGGVYDNMGEEWFAGWDDRVEGWPELATVSPPVDHLVVVNASGGWGWRTIRRPGLLARELLGVLGSKDVLYNESTRVRRHELVARFKANEASGKGYVGAVVHIPQTPYEAADAFAGRGDDRSARAAAVLAALGDTTADREEWARTAKADTDVPTVLRKLGRETTARLLRHSYVLTMCNLHVVHGYPLLPMPSVADFARLCDAPGQPFG